MGTVALSAFLPELNPHVAGCPEPLILNALSSATTEFCNRTLIWQERLPEVQVTSSGFPYTIPVEPHATFERVISAQVGTIVITPTSYKSLDDLPNWDTILGTPQNFLITIHGKLIVYPLPAISAPLRLTVAFTAARGAILIEDFLFTRWRDVLVHGALSLLHAMPERAWSKPDKVGLHGAKFEQGISLARSEQDRGQVVSDKTINMRPFA